MKILESKFALTALGAVVLAVALQELRHLSETSQLASYPNLHMALVSRPNNLKSGFWRAVSVDTAQLEESGYSHIEKTSSFLLWKKQNQGLIKFLQDRLERLQEKQLIILESSPDDLSRLTKLSPDLMVIEGSYFDHFSPQSYELQEAESVREIREFTWYNSRTDRPATSFASAQKNSPSLRYLNNHPKLKTLGGDWRSLHQIWRELDRQKMSGAEIVGALEAVGRLRVLVMLARTADELSSPGVTYTTPVMLVPKGSADFLSHVLEVFGGKAID